jgi:cytochrome c oxidase assembly factor 5
MVDMRKRFRGNQPITVNKDLDGGSHGGMLYAGKSAFGGVVKEVSLGERMSRESVTEVLEYG